MIVNPDKKIAFVSSYKPRKCGIATFTSDLIHNVRLAAKERFHPAVIAMHSGNEIEYDDPVKLRITQIAISLDVYRYFKYTIEL